MVEVWKEVISPGRVWYNDQETGEPRSLDVTPEMVRYWSAEGKKMLSLGLSIPAPVEHQADAYPMTPGQRAAKNLLNNAGWVKDYRVDPGDRLFSLVNVEDPEVVKKLPTTIKWTSPWINSFTDGDGRQWNNVITHLALTSRPRITRQQPFTGIKAAMSLAPSLPGPKAGAGYGLSKAGLLIKAGDGGLTPAYPMAFSLWGGVALAGGDMPPPEGPPGKGKKPPMKPEGGDKPPADPMAKPGADEPKPGASPDVPPGEPGLMPMEPSLVDPDGDIGVHEVLSDLLEALDIHLEEGATKENFLEKLYQAVMGSIKAGGLKGGAAMADKGMGNQPGGNPGNPNNLPPNPPVQEQQPMFMSLEQANAIADPTMKQIALSLVQAQQQNASLQKNLFSTAQAKRQARIDRLCRNLPPDAQAKLKAHAQLPGMGFSLGTDGAVADPMETMLDIMDQAVKELPDQLRGRLTPGWKPDEIQHPQDLNGGPSEDRLAAVEAQLARSMGLPPSPVEPAAQATSV